ncbi:MAG: chemotaxis response regulator protein-glutamate methylesterase [Thermoanaerobacteraceae bacterium]|nr:chemotaxis response regulator protein-glutamate methylesterase [Thermoanaerobacteraceae bacterium]
MSPQKIRVLIVDDSAFMRVLLKQVLESAGDIQVVGVARDGRDALAKAASLRPDVITLDVNMPHMDGLTTLHHLINTNPHTRVIMLSSWTKEGAETTLRALELGAIDFVAKPGSSSDPAVKELKEEIIEKVRQAARARVSARPVPTPPKSPSPFDWGPKVGSLQNLILMGTSTGGPRTLSEILSRLPGNLPAGIVIVQHMPPTFTASLAKRLDETCPVRVEEAAEGTLIEPGKAVIARGGYHIDFIADAGGEIRCRLTLEPSTARFRPSVDVMFENAMKIYPPSRIIGVLLTGMGNDGARGMAELRRRGGYTIAESRETATIWGMPRAAYEAGGVDELLPSHSIPDALLARVVKK